MEAGRQEDHAVLARLRADLEAERAAREADQAALASLRTELETAQARLTEAGAADEGGLLDRVAGLADEIEFQRRAREQAEAAAAHVPSAESGRVVADLDAAASALRERAGNGMAVGSAAAPADPPTLRPRSHRPRPMLRPRPLRPRTPSPRPRRPSGRGGTSSPLRAGRLAGTRPAARSAPTRGSAARWSSSRTTTPRRPGGSSPGCCRSRP